MAAQTFSSLETLEETILHSFINFHKPLKLKSIEIWPSDVHARRTYLVYHILVRIGAGGGQSNFTAGIAS